VDKNVAAGADPDSDVTAGLFMYPVLMAADILMFKAHKIPVGRDQVQHIEMARDIAQSFNHLYGEHFVLPEAAIDDTVALLPGTDGRKMSKSYDNAIPLFAPPAELRKQIAGIVTDSRAPGEPKEVEGSALFQIFEAFASPEETQQLRKAYADGIAWRDAKQMLFERIDGEIAPMRERYDALVNNPAQLEKVLRAGADKARALAPPFLAELRSAVGLRNLASGVAPAARQKQVKAAMPSFKQYREADGQHYFKLVDAGGALLAQSTGFATPQEAGRLVAQLRQGRLEGAEAALQLADGVSRADVAAALATLAQG
jgi:tryptophanyl-tRNA synthetase